MGREVEGSKFQKESLVYKEVKSDYQCPVQRELYESGAPRYLVGRELLGMPRI